VFRVGIVGKIIPLEFFRSERAAEEPDVGSGVG